MPSVLAGQPLQVAVLADVHHGVRAEVRRPASGRRPGSGGWAAGRGRGRSRSGSRRTRAAAGPSRTTLPARSAASTISPSGSRESVDVQLAGRRAPVLARSPSRRSCGQGGEPARGSRAAVIRTGLPASCSSVSQSGSCPPAAISAWISASPSCSATPGRRRPSAADVVARARACACSSRTALAGVSRPTALPIRECLVGYADSISAILPLGRRDVPQPRVPDRDAGHPGGPLGVGHVDGQAVRRRSP